MFLRDGQNNSFGNGGFSVYDDVTSMRLAGQIDSYKKEADPKAGFLMISASSLVFSYPSI